MDEIERIYAQGQRATEQCPRRQPQGQARVPRRADATRRRDRRSRRRPDAALLERVPNPHPRRLYLARFAAPEFTSLCPITGQPDFAHLVIDYAPGRWLVESKSLKLYLASFRNHGAFHEDCTLAIAGRLVDFLRAALAAHRRLLVSAGRHADRRVLADGQAARGPVDSRPGRAAVSRARLIDRRHDLTHRCPCVHEPDRRNSRRRRAMSFTSHTRPRDRRRCRRTEWAGMIATLHGGSRRIPRDGQP